MSPFVARTFLSVRFVSARFVILQAMGVSCAPRAAVKCFPQEMLPKRGRNTEEIPRFARNDNLCHSERSEESLSASFFSGSTYFSYLVLLSLLLNSLLPYLEILVDALGEAHPFPSAPKCDSDG